MKRTVQLGLLDLMIVSVIGSFVLAFFITPVPSAPYVKFASVICKLLTCGGLAAVVLSAVMWMVEPTLAEIKTRSRRIPNTRFFWISIFFASVPAIVMFFLIFYFYRTPTS